jgi:non-ribosomal peptide synthetase component F/acyl carrier protein
MALPHQVETSAGTDEKAICPVPPRTLNEEAILAIWRDVLGRSDFGVFDDFFDLNGHSLHAIRVVARIRKNLGADVPVRDFFEASTVAALASAVEAASSAGCPVVTPRPPDADPVLSFDQQRLWLENQLLPGAAYNVHGRRRLLGRLDAATLEASLRAVIIRHESLRTRFPTESHGPVQVVDEHDENWRLPVVDLSGAEDPGGAASRLMDEQALTPFDLQNGPLLRCLLVRLGDTEHLLSVTMHHIISDAWSVGLLVRELSALYEAGGDCERAALSPLPVQYRDFAVWQRQRLGGEELERQLAFWRSHLAGACPALALPVAQRRSPSQKAGGQVRFTLSEEETAALHELCRAHGVTMFMTLLSALATVLSRWAGQPDVVIGVPVAGRNAAGTEGLIGFFVNTLPIRVGLSGNPAFTDLLGRVRQVALEAYAHADAPFDRLVKEMNAGRDPNRTPLFQAVLNVIDSSEAERIGGVSVEALEIPVQPSKFDLALTTTESRGVLQMKLDFNADRYDAAMMRILACHLTTLLRLVALDPAKGILFYSFENPAQGAAAGTHAEAPGWPGAPCRSVERFARLRDRIAVIDGDGEWSYRRLDQAADRITRLLTERYAPYAGHVGVIRRPVAGFVAAVLGCMKAGAPFSLIEAAASRSGSYPGVSVVLDASPAAEASHGAVDVSALLGEDAGQAGPEPPSADVPGPENDWAAGRFSLVGEDRFAILSSLPGHLLSAMSSALCSGAALVLPEDKVTGDIDALVGWLRDNSVTVVYMSPPVLRAIAGREVRPRLPALRYAFVGNSGDLLSHDVDLMRQISRSCRCVSLYRVDREGRPLAAYVVPDGWELRTAPPRVPLGAAASTAVRLLHPSGLVAAAGEVAEIYSGTYGTGDLGRRLADGTLEFAGYQGVSAVSDPVETLAALRDLPGVHDAIVREHVTMDGRTTLVGYVASRNSEITAPWIRQQLISHVADYLVPQRLFVLDEFPLTAEGDYDVTVLPEPRGDGGEADGYIAPRTPIERQLSEILREMLDVDRVGVHDSFFELGGFSLLATLLTSRIREEFGVELSLRDVFEAPTMDQLAQLIVRTQGEAAGAGELEALLDEISSLEA